MEPSSTPPARCELLGVPGVHRLSAMGRFFPHPPWGSCHERIRSAISTACGEPMSEKTGYRAAALRPGATASAPSTRTKGPIHLMTFTSHDGSRRALLRRMLPLLNDTSIQHSLLFPAEDLAQKLPERTRPVSPGPATPIPPTGAGRHTSASKRYGSLRPARRW